MNGESSVSDFPSFLQCIRTRKSKDPFLFMGAQNDILQVAPLTVCMRRPMALVLMDGQRRLLMRNSRFYRNPFFLVDISHRPMLEATWKAYEDTCTLDYMQDTRDVFLMASDAIQYDPMCVLESVVTAVFIYMHRKMTCPLLCPYDLGAHPCIQHWLAGLGLLDRLILLQEGVPTTYTSVTIPPHAIELTTHNVEGFMRWTYLKEAALLRAPGATDVTLFPERIVVLPQYGAPTEDAWQVLLHQVQKQNYSLVCASDAPFLVPFIHHARVVVMLGGVDAMQCLNMTAKPGSVAVFLLTPTQVLTHHFLAPMAAYVNTEWKVLEMNPEEPYAFSMLDELMTL